MHILASDQKRFLFFRAIFEQPKIVSATTPTNTQTTNVYLKLDKKDKLDLMKSPRLEEQLGGGVRWIWNIVPPLKGIEALIDVV